MSQDKSKLEKALETAPLKVQDDSLKENASNASGAGLEVRVTRVYDGVGLSNNRICRWCKDRECTDVSLQEAYKIGAFQRHDGCGCEIDYTSAKGVRTQQTKKGEWVEVGSKPTSYKELKKQKVKTERDFDIQNTNPGYKSGEWGYKHNCQRCVSTCEMRYRGYDVVAKPRPFGEDSLAWYWEAAWIDPETGKPPLRHYCLAGSGEKQVIKCMKDWGDGSRGIVGVLWENGEGHVFLAENRRGEIFFVDPQDGSLDCSGYFQKAKKGCYTNVTKISDCIPHPRILECCTNRGK